ncbi:hypothetical protein [Paenibacillus lutrae]|uniref:Uncharacterized protein n=1 Tax=Paenibacillus lutrae TaxID=2078573 RepID=A0A7X3FLU1_9BACL|nr:hypothetical protein [Paenibacillus lutrae]MVP02105.1 hypothetical protein [Paenibacillus lutrae]
MKNAILNWSKKYQHTMFSVSAVAVYVALKETGIDPLDNMITYLEGKRVTIMAVFPALAVIYSIFQALGWYTMTEDEQNGVKKRIRNAFVVAFGIMIIVWFVLDADTNVDMTNGPTIPHVVTEQLV